MELAYLKLQTTTNQVTEKQIEGDNTEENIDRKQLQRLKIGE